MNFEQYFSHFTFHVLHVVDSPFTPPFLQGVNIELLRRYPQMKLNKFITSAILSTLLVIFLMLTGCAMYRDISPGTVKNIPVGEYDTAGTIKTGSAIVAEEKVTILPLNEPAPSPEYTIGQGDVLFINVSGKPEFSSMANTSTYRNWAKFRSLPAAGLTATAIYRCLIWVLFMSAG